MVNALDNLDTVRSYCHTYTAVADSCHSWLDGALALCNLAGKVAARAVRKERMPGEKMARQRDEMPGSRKRARDMPALRRDYFWLLSLLSAVQ